VGREAWQRYWKSSVAIPMRTDATTGSTSSLRMALDTRELPTGEGQVRAGSALIHPPCAPATPALWFTMSSSTICNTPTILAAMRSWNLTI